MKRLLALLLCLVMALSLIPAAAAEDVEIVDIEESEETIPVVETEPENVPVPNGDVAINETNFPDDNFRSYVSENFDTNGDGKLSASEIAAATSIYVTECSITTLKGVEYFTALEELRCVETTLTSLDIGNFTKLEWLNVAGNALTTLKVRNCPNLNLLDCFYNQLTALDVSGCPALEYLHCFDNNFTSLDLSGCPALLYLDCGDNHLTTLDVSCLPALVTLRCYGNDLTALDVSSNTALEYLTCGGNALTTLDLSCRPALKTLHCPNNSLTTLDLSNNMALETLFCGGNPLTSLDLYGREALKELSVEGCTELTYLNCARCSLKRLYADDCTALKELDCEKNEMKSLHVRRCTALRKLYCCNNQLTWLDLSNNTELMTLDCFGNSISSLSIGSCPSLVNAYLHGSKTERTVDGVTFWTYYDSLGCSLSVDPDTKVNAEAEPTVVTQPVDRSVAEGGVASFTVEAEGGNLSYQWQWRTGSSGAWKDCTSATTGYNTPTLKVNATAARNGYQYRCKVSNSAGSTESNFATLTVTAASKPTITTQPKSVSVAVGSTAKFTVAATGAESYQWQWRTGSSGTWKDCTSATTGYNKATLEVSATTARNGYQYRCKVSNSAGTTNSSYATLTVTSASKPTITTQPKSVSAAVGGTAKFTVAATGAESYQWQWRTGSSGTWKDCTSATTGYNKATLEVSATTTRNGYQYRCQVSNSAGTTTSNYATLTVTSASKPTITTQPKSVSTAAGSTAKFTVAATGAESYQWQWRTGSSGTWKDCTSTTTGYNKATLEVSATAARNGYQYRCQVSNSVGTTTSGTATLTVLTKPAITTQPTSKTVSAGTTVKFTVKATGGDLSYQWQYRTSSSGEWKNCTGTGATTATLTIEAKSYRNGYQYRCKVSNAVGYKYSSAATLTVK